MKKLEYNKKYLKPKLSWLLILACLSFYAQQTYAQKTITVKDGDGSSVVSWNYSGSNYINFSSNCFMTVDVKNETSSEVVVNLWYKGSWQVMEGYRIVPPGQTEQVKVAWLRSGVGGTWSDKFPSIRGLPGNHPIHWLAFDDNMLKQVKVTVSWENHSGESQSVIISKPYASGNYSYPSENTYALLDKPFFDEMGQFVHDDWDLKLSDKSELQTLAEHDIAKYTGASFDNGFSRYGGIKQATRSDSTGFFRTEKIDGKWWLIDPEGYLFWSQGVTGARSGASTSTANRSELFPDFSDERETSLWPLLSNEVGSSIDFYNMNVKRKYGTNWYDIHEEVTYGRMKSWGLNTHGCWGDIPDKVMHPFTYFAWHGNSSTRLSHSAKTKPIPNIYHSDFENGLRNQLVGLRNDYADNIKWLIGIFTGNEHYWGATESELAETILKEDGSKTGSGYNNPLQVRDGMLNWLKNKYSSIQDLNSAWGSNFTSFSEIRPGNYNSTYGTVLKEYTEHYMDVYYKTCRDVIKTELPNTLYLGDRLYKEVFYTCKIVQRVASRYCDVVSYNSYTFTLDNFDNALEQDVDKPCIIGEFHFGTFTEGVWGGGNNTFAADAQHKGDAYKIYLKSALKHPNLVGAHWFQYVDQVASGRGKDGENFGIGIVNVTDQPYLPLVEAIKETSEKMYETRTGKSLPTGLNDLPSSLEINIFPNPNDGQFFVKTNNANTTKLNVYSITGQPVYKKTLKGTKCITLPHGLKGMFLVRVNNSEQESTQRIVVQ